MALERFSDSGGVSTPGSESEVPVSSPPQRAHGGFAEPPALFRSITDLPAELRALRGYVEPVFLRWAAERAETVGLGADAIVRRSGVLDSDAMLGAVSAALGIDVDLLEDSTNIPLDVPDILSTGLLPASVREGQTHLTIALLGNNLRTVHDHVAENPNLAKQIRITSHERLRDFVQRSNGDRLANDAARGLQQRWPDYSAGAVRFAGYILSFLGIFATAALFYYFSFTQAFLAIELLLALTFLTWAGLRIYACFHRVETNKWRPLTERELPTYSILVPLYREAQVVPDLVRSISALNYPREKLDVKLILEPDDEETIAAVQAIHLDPCFEVVIAPRLGPRTKPKALQAALPFARGEFVVIYDAEDRPHPDQLRDAYLVFLTGEERLACVQAKLAIDNARPRFLTEHFRAEYSGLFDVLLPALAHLRLPLPLGGTSNHFRTDALRKAGGWDPHNVTEDADLGIRLARFGYTTGVVDSTTWEEAPDRFMPWLMQRTRWFKGWLQTYIVHMRSPLQLLKQLRLRGFLAFQLLIGGTVLAALVHPIFLVWLIKDIAFGWLFTMPESLLEMSQKALAFLILISGYLASALLAIVGLRRRRLLLSAWIVLTIPAYWLLLSAAAWRAVWKLIAAPYHWEKTEHGIAARKGQPEA